MCGRYALTTPADVLASLFAAVIPVPTDGARYNIAPSQSAPVVRFGARRGGRILTPLRWGLVPGWAKAPTIAYKTINARSETAAQMPAFRDAMRRRRCVVPADGFYEWQAIDDRRQPFFIHRADGQPLAFAGLWERWRERPGDDPLDTFTILTTDANAELTPLHDRMPVILEPEDVARWIDPHNEDPATLTDLLRPAPDGTLECYPVSPRVNRPEHDDRSLLDRIELAPPGEAPGDQQMLFPSE